MKTDSIVYKARVSKVSIPMNDGEIQRKIYVTPLEREAAGLREKMATPPSPFPTSILGSGVISYPAVGQECLVAEWKGSAHIIAYIQPRGFSEYGQLVPEKLDEGSVMLSVNGNENAKILFTRQGYIGLISNEFAQMSINGTTRTFFAKARNSTIEYAGGWRHDLYDPDTKLTESRHVYAEHKDIKGFSDANKRLEQGNALPLPPVTPTYRYPSKTIYDYGHIEGESITYHKRTIQSINPINSYDKTVVTSSRLGYQKEHERYNGKVYPEGTIIENSYKKNFEGNVGTYLERLGKLQTGEQAGEIYRKQIYEGLNKGMPYGVPITNPIGEGEGYSYDLNSAAAYQYIESFGELSDKTLYRYVIHKKDTAGKIVHRIKKTYGGDSISYCLMENGKDKFERVFGSADVSNVRTVERKDSGFFNETIFGKDAA